jgi:hypothetical protein
MRGRTSRTKPATAAAQRAVVAQEPQHGCGDGDRQRAPRQLLERQSFLEGASGGEVEAVDHHQAQTVEQGDDGQQERVGVGRLPAQQDVEAEGQDEQTGHLSGEAARDRP